jgi:predicted MFS family arabinose efflux permease
MGIKMQSMVLTFVWLLAALFYSFQYILRVLPSLMLNDILLRFNIDAEIFGQYSGLYYIGYALAHLPLGFALDRFGIKKVLPICVLIAVGGLLPLLYATHWGYACAGRILLGIGSSAAILGLFKVILYCFGEARFTRMLGISVAIGLCGAIFGGMPVSIMISKFGWQPVVQAAVVLGIGLALALYLILPSDQKHEANADEPRPSIWQDLKILVNNRKFLLLSAMAGLMIGPLEGFADVWGAEFFRVTYQLSKTTADGLPSFIFWGMLIGSPILSYICDKKNKYFEMIILSAFIMGSCFIAMLTGGMPIYMLCLNLLIIGIFCSYQIPAIYKISTYLPNRMMGIATASVNMIFMFFGYLFHTTIGKIMTVVAPQAQDGVALYTQDAFVTGLSVIPIAQLIAVLGFSYVLFSAKTKRVPVNELAS